MNDLTPFLRRFSIRLRMVGAIAMVLAMFLLVGLTGGIGGARVMHLNEEFMDHTVHEIRQIASVQLALSDLRRQEMSMALDIGDAADIHPRNKFDVGERLALWALRNEYGRELVPSGPLYRAMRVEGAAIRLEFDFTGSGLMVGHKSGRAPAQPAKEAKLARFAIAGEDRAWRWAEARIDGTTVLVSHPDVAAPVAARYAWSVNPEGANLYNRDGLSASPFRTDAW